MVFQGRSWSGHERNCCFLNTLASPAAGGRFATISAASGIDFLDDGRAIAVVDWDHDGDLDLWISNRNAPRLRLLRNDANSGNHFLALRLVGNGNTTNRDAIGARVEVVTRKPDVGSRSSDGTDGEPNRPPTSDLRTVKTLRAGEGFLAQSSKWLHFGLGGSDHVIELAVHWPDGEHETFTGVHVDSSYRLVQGSGQAAELKRSRNDLAIRPSTPQLPAGTDRARIPLVTLYTMPGEVYYTPDGGLQPLPLSAGRSVLVNLWSSSCRPCLTELNQFAQREQELRRAGVEIVALSVDLVGDDPAEPLEVNTLVSKMAFPFPAGFASPRLLHFLQTLHDHVVPSNKPLPLPSSFLVDPQGRLAVIYKGPVSIDQVLADLQHTSGTLAERQRRAALLPGRLLQDQILIDSDRRVQSRNLFNMAETMRGSRRTLAAITHYHEALRFKPDFVDAHNNLAWLRATSPDATSRNGREALEHAMRAVQLAGNDNALILDSLAAAYAEVGSFDEAVRWQQKAVQIAPEKQKNDLAARLALYKQQRPYRESK